MEVWHKYLDKGEYRIEGTEIKIPEKVIERGKYKGKVDRMKEK